MLTRLGDVLYWLGCILAVLAVAWGAKICFWDEQPEGPYIFALVAAVAFAAWAIGRACRYIFAGK